MKYEFKIRICAEVHSETENKVRVYVVCHKCNGLVHTNRLLLPAGPVFTDANFAGMYEDLAYHSCDD